MKKFIKQTLLLATLLPTATTAQTVNWEMYPDYNSVVNPDYSLMRKSVVSTNYQGKSAEKPLPDHVDNSELKYFPPVFGQAGGSCGSASRICYMFTHEINSFRNANGKLMTNRYPSHFVWLFTYGNAGKEDFIKYIGVPNAEVYGGNTYSHLFGSQDAASKDFGWMQGYDKWYSAMWNRMYHPSTYPVNVGSEEGRTALKRWLYNHNGDPDFNGGGLAGIGVASGGSWIPIPQTPTNDEIGVTGKKFVKRWGTQVDHALTIVGYDDRIEFDLNGNGIIGEKDADEVGAWIIVNSWGPNWCNGGFVYCPYAYGGKSFSEDGKGGYYFDKNFWKPEVYHVRKNYRPLRTIKIKMDYSRRSEMALSAGISTDLNATQPDKTIDFKHFTYAGDGNHGKTQPAPEVPMLGKWADGKLHYEPMEFGYDLTDFSAGYNKNQSLKYFFIVETREWSEGHGKIYNASIIDYEFNHQGIETPFNISPDGVDIRKEGNKTIISTIVYGESYYAPQNLLFNDNLLSWNAPVASGHALKAYKLYCNNLFVSEISPNTTTYELSEEPTNTTFSVSALYEDGIESDKISISTPVVSPTINKVADFKHSGFIIPNVFKKSYQEATIEFWINPYSFSNYNQCAGPGWGDFMMHVDAEGNLIAGWDKGREQIISIKRLRKATWNHIAITIEKNIMKLYINGLYDSSITSKQYSGIGGFGDFVFHANDNGNDIDARIDEIRIWDYAKTNEEIFNKKNIQYDGQVMPNGLIAYFKGDTLNTNDKIFLRESVCGNHAEVLNSNFNSSFNTQLKMFPTTDKLSLSIIPPAGALYTGLPIHLTAQHSDAVNRLIWNSQDANAINMNITSPALVFPTPGNKEVNVIGYNSNGESIKASIILNILDAPTPDATFTMTNSEISAGERVSFAVEHPMFGYKYEWNLPGSDIKKANNVKAAATYMTEGSFEATLTVTAPNGKKTSSSKIINVSEVAPAADFDITPTIIVKGQTTYLKDKSKYNPKNWLWTINNANQNYVINGQNSSLTINQPGVYDVNLEVRNNTGRNIATRKRALIVCNADSKNGLNFTRTNSHIKLAKAPFSMGQRTFTIEWWMNPSSLVTYSTGFGDSEGKFRLKTDGDGAMKIHVNGREVSCNKNYVILDEWHHYAVTFNSGRAGFYRDGEYLYGKSVGRSFLPEIKDFYISMDEAPFMGQIDEFRIWNKVLSKELIKEFSNQPIENVAEAEKDYHLAVYYNFNQNGGDVIDATSNNNNGIRMNFGPDGDAWSSSLGVFSITNEEAQPKPEDVTSLYLKNYKSAFAFDENSDMNPNNKDRHFAIDEWILENSIAENNVTTSVHVDKHKDYGFTFTSGWDNFSYLKNHKAYQTIYLPAGRYTFTASYGIYEGSCDDSYLVAAEGNSLPDSENISKSLASIKMESKSNDHMNNSITFILFKETQVSLGLVINQNKKATCVIDHFNLIRTPIQAKEADGTKGFDITIDKDGFNSLYLPYPTIIPEGVTAYAAKGIVGTTLEMETITSKILPAKVGVIINATPGTYHFEPCSETVSITSLLTGVLTETNADPDKRYYQLETGKNKGFRITKSNAIEANKAYLVRSADDNNDFYKINIVPVGINYITNETLKEKIYDLSGREIIAPRKGLYITNQRKVLVK